MATKQQRKTAARKARQDAALRELRRRAPQSAYVLAPLGTPIPITTPSMLRETSKQKLVEGYNRIAAREGL